MSERTLKEIALDLSRKYEEAQETVISEYSGSIDADIKKPKAEVSRIRQEIEAETANEPQWIPCSERLPDDDRTKVVTLANGNVEAGYYSNGDWWCIGDTIALENPTVIAWMPLPEPYKAERKEDSKND